MNFVADSENNVSVFVSLREHYETWNFCTELKNQEVTLGHT